MNRLAVIAIASLALHGCGGTRHQPPAEARSAVESTPAAPAAEAPPATAATTPTDPVAEAPTRSRAEFETMMVKTVALINAMGDVAARSGDDCGAAAASLEKVVVDNRAFIAEANEYEDNAEVDRMISEWMNAHYTEVVESISKVEKLTERCASYPEFMAVFEKFRNL